MGDQKHSTAFYVFWTIVVLAVFGLGMYFYAKGMQASQDNHDFNSVCTYEGGHTEGDVCIKGDKVILTQDQWKEKVK